MKEFFSKWWSEILVATMAFFAPIWALGAYCTLLIFADLIFGISAAKSRGEEITSRAMSRTISKFILYNLAIVVGHGASLTFYPEIDLAKIVAAAITLVELKSIDEKFVDIFGFSVYSKLIKILKRTEREKQDV